MSWVTHRIGRCPINSTLAPTERLLEARDVVGSIRYVKSQPELADMDIALWSRCMGGNATIEAMYQFPEEFKGKNIKAISFIELVSGQTFVERGAANLGLDPDEARDMLRKKLKNINGQDLMKQNPALYGSAVTVPVMMTQRRRDFLVNGEEDGMAIFESLGSEEKELVWIEDSN